jgi:hypothetical protein
VNKARDELVLIECVIVVIIVIWGIASGITSSKNLANDNYRTYECDYKSTSITQTRIETVIDGRDIIIKGNAIAKLKITDPLGMYDADGNEIAYAGDTYGFIAQDTHGIYVNGEFEINMEGNVSLLGNVYTLKDKDGNALATIDCNSFDTKGYVTDNDGNIIASYESLFAVNDYTVKICDNDICSDEAMLLIIASYVSDVKYDS